MGRIAGGVLVLPAESAITSHVMDEVLNEDSECIKAMLTKHACVVFPVGVHFVLSQGRVMPGEGIVVGTDFR